MEHLPISRQAYLQKLRDSYDYYYTLVEGAGDSGLPLSFFAEFHAKDVGYVLVKSARIWSAESNEYAYIFETPHLDVETARRCVDYAMADGEPRIVPAKDHKDSYIIAAFVADVIEPEAQKFIRERKFYKSYKFGFEGWSALKIAAAELEKELVVTNKAGRGLEKFFKKLLRSEKV